MTAPARNRLTQRSVSETPSNCRSFYDDLYQTQLSGCSAFPESRLQSLPHPYSPLRANKFLRISRNRVQASNPYLTPSTQFYFRPNSDHFRTRSGAVRRPCTMNVWNEPVQEMLCVVKRGTPPVLRWKLCDVQHRKSMSVSRISLIMGRMSIRVLG